MDLVKKIGYSRIFALDGAILYSAGLMVDGDGAPDCYNPDSSLGRDALANAGRPGNWWGIATDDEGRPHIQTASDPCPGFYVSTTALQNPAYQQSDPRRYVDAATVPFIVIPGGLGLGISMGDLALCFNIATGDNDYAICADIGPEHQIGEGSIALASALSIPDSPRTGGVGGGVVYCIFPSSGKGYQKFDVWFDQANDLFRKWGGLVKLKTLLRFL